MFEVACGQAMMGGGPRDMGLDEALEAVAAAEAAARRGNGGHNGHNGHNGALAHSSRCMKPLGCQVPVSGAAHTVPRSTLDWCGANSLTRIYYVLEKN